ncbi:hypothetical protein ACQV2T_02610 [Facklamia sp. P13069]|uniref:hypothetical protein n=1 Tax=Facklamia sp. P13069 TaxID=3421954 RepID=UPI003D1807F9
MTYLSYSYFYQNWFKNFSIDSQQIQTFCQKYNQSQTIKSRQIELTTIQRALKDFKDNQTVYLAVLQQIIKQDFLLTNIQLNDWQQLVIMIVCIQALIELYKKYDLPLNILQNTLSDLFLRINLSQAVGLSTDDFEWLARIFRLRIFKLGELQFEFTLFDSATLPKDISYINNGSKILQDALPIISVHIMQDSLIDEAHSSTAFYLARAFKKRYLTNFPAQYFYCYSWLLNPNNSFLLGSQSNILSFSSNFDLIAHSAYPDMALEHIYGSKDIHPDSMPQITSLQRRAKSHLSFLGIGVGIVPF